jgi:hypothetical protein
MKVEVRTPEHEKTFEPIQLVLTIQSKDELLSLYHRMFFNSKDWAKCNFRAVGRELPNCDVDDTVADSIFMCVDDILRERNA